MSKTCKLFSTPGYAVYLAFLCLTLFCLPFLSMNNIAAHIGMLMLYLFLVWLFLIVNLVLISRPCNEEPGSRKDAAGIGP